MASVAKIVKLQVCSSLWANLCFEVGGIVETSNVTLGQNIPVAFPFSTLYGQLGVATESVLEQVQVVGGFAGHHATPLSGVTIPELVNEPANLWDSSDIDAQVAAQNQSGAPPAALMALRAESIKAALDKACALRANAYYARYANQTAIIAQMQQNYSATFLSGPNFGKSNPTSKPGYLNTLQGLAANQYTALSNAYNADPIRKTQGKNPGVVQSTTSTLQSWNAPGLTTSISFSNSGAQEGSVESGESSSASVSQIETQSTPASLQSDPNASQQYETMSYTDYGFRIPSIECNAQNVRAQISLMDEQFAVFMAGQSLPYLQNVFPNELLAMDMDVKRLQVAYLNTILMSPITGVITGVYKNVGDRVLPGETVVRVESTSSVYLVGVLIYRGMISLQANVSIQTTLFSSSSPVTITGTVVAARGDRSGDDRWEVVFLCPNGTSGNPTLPLNYYFDYDEITSITFS
jgi:biotin carboxyl carrier protein